VPTPSDSTNPSEPFGLVRKIAIWAFLAIFWALFLYFIAYIIGWVPHETHVTKYNQQTGQEQPEVYETTSYLIWQTFKGLNYISPTVAALATVGVVFFTATLWRSTHLLWQSAAMQAKHIEDSAKAARDANDHARKALVVAQRPWVQITDIDVTNGITWHPDDAAIIEYTCKVKNVGNTPAINVWCIPNGIITRGRRDNVVLDNYRGWSDSIRQSTKTPGFTVFPGQPIGLPLTLRISREQMENPVEAGEITEHAILPGAQDAPGLHIYLHGCVSYYSPVDEVQHQTGFIYELRQVVPGQPASRGGAPLEIAIGADIPKASVAVYRTELPVVID
jgi:hypothetical protein